MKNNILCTIGYEGTGVDALIGALQAAKVKALLDVRAVPLSRKPGFSKNKLAARLAEAGIEYYGLKGLGTPAAGRDAARKGRIAQMRKIFLGQMKTKEAQIDLEEAVALAAKKRCCLLCFEHDPATCHRLIVAEKMMERQDLTLKHLSPLMAG